MRILARITICFESLNRLVFHHKSFLLNALGRKIVIFDISGIDMIPFQIPIIKDLEQRAINRLQIYISAPKALRSHVEIKKYKKAPFSNLDRIKVQCTFVSSTIHAIGPKTSKTVFMSHGFPVKFDQFPTKCLTYFNHYICLGDAYREFLLENFSRANIDSKTKGIYPFGYPKINNVSSRIGSDKKSILYAPSWDAELSLSSYGKELFEELSEISNITKQKINIKIHPAFALERTRTSTSTDVLGQLSEAFQISSTKDFLVDVSRIPFKDLVAETSVLITDWSGISLEFLYFGIQTVFLPVTQDVVSKYESIYGCPQSVQEKLLSHPFSSGGRPHGILVHDLSDLKDIVLDIKDSSRNESESFREFRERIFYNEIHSVGKITNLINILADAKCS